MAIIQNAWKVTYKDWVATINPLDWEDTETEHIEDDKLKFN